MNHGAPKSILIADSDDFFKVRLCEALIQRGHKTRVASDEGEVIKLLENSADKTDFLVIDHYLPPDDSFKILEWIKDNGLRDKFPILVLCKESISEAKMDELKQKGVAGFMLKNHTHDQLSYQIDQILFSPVHQRSNPRISISIPAVFTYGKRSEESRILNLSEEGLFWYSRIRHEPGTEISIKFTLPGNDKEMNLTGVVMRYRRMRELKNLFTEVGLKLKDLSENEQTDMKDFLDNHIRDAFPSA